MTYHESHEREKASWWLGFLAGSALWALVGMGIVMVFEKIGG